MASTATRDRRRTLRYRHLLVRQMVQMKNRISGLLMETGVSHNKQRLHKVKYFRELLATNKEVDESIRPLLKLSRESIERLQKTDYALVSSLERDPLLRQRLENLRTVPGVGPITALTWALDIGDVSRFHSVKQAICYCGLCGDEKSSAEKILRTPLSKQRNKHIQHVLVEELIVEDLLWRACAAWNSIGAKQDAVLILVNKFGGPPLSRVSGSRFSVHAEKAS